MDEVGEWSIPLQCIEWSFRRELLNSGEDIFSKPFCMNDLSRFQLCVSQRDDSKRFEREIDLILNNFFDDVDDDDSQLNEDFYTSCYLYSAENPLISMTVTECKSMEVCVIEGHICLGSFNLHSLFYEEQKNRSVDTLTVVLKMFKKDYEVNKDYPLKRESTLAQHLENLFLSEQETDVLIRVKGSPFKCHRSILAARSKVFAAMFQQDMAEKRNGEVVINDCDPDCFKNFLLYLYSEKSDFITANNAVGLYSIADKYDIEELKKICIRCMVKNLCADIICDVLVLSTMYDEADLLEAGTKFFCENTQQILGTNQWTSFQKTNLAFSNDLLLKYFRNLKSNNESE